jgi:hypothetical protein
MTQFSHIGLRAPIMLSCIVCYLKPVAVTPVRGSSQSSLQAGRSIHNVRYVDPVHFDSSQSMFECMISVIYQLAVG